MYRVTLGSHPSYIGDPPTAEELARAGIKTFGKGKAGTSKTPALADALEYLRRQGRRAVTTQLAARLPPPLFLLELAWRPSPRS